MKQEKHIIKCKFNKKEIIVDDGGAYKELPVFKNKPVEEIDGMWIKICSWNDDAEHNEFDKFIGRKIKVTIETID